MADRCCQRVCASAAGELKKARLPAGWGEPRQGLGEWCLLELKWEDSFAKRVRDGCKRGREKVWCESKLRSPREHGIFRGPGNNVKLWEPKGWGWESLMDVGRKARATSWRQSCVMKDFTLFILVPSLFPNLQYNLYPHVLAVDSLSLSVICCFISCPIYRLAFECLSCARLCARSLEHWAEWKENATLQHLTG